MKSFLFPVAAISAAVLTLSACSSLHDKIADNAMQKKQLADGSPVSIAINLPPTAKWGCHEIGTRQSYKWAWLQAQAPMQFTVPEVLLTKKALDYANQQNLKPNYINMHTPMQVDVQGLPLSIASDAVVTYYQCKLINPDKDFGTQKGIGAAIY